MDRGTLSHMPTCQAGSDEGWMQLVPGRDICADCQQIDLSTIANFFEQSNEMGHPEVQLDDVRIELSPLPLHAMREREACRICQTFVQMAEATWYNEFDCDSTAWNDETSENYIDACWEEQGDVVKGQLKHESGPVLDMRFGQLHLEINTSSTETIGQASTKSDVAWFQNSLEFRKNPRESHTRKVQVPIVRSWLNACNQHHPFQEDPENAAVDVILIDVQTRRLVNGNTHEKYYALRYVWGGLRIFQTVKENRKSLEIEGALDGKDIKLPTVIQDAMELVRALGDRYLWVDCLCICQDDEFHKHSQISQMGFIYGRAFLTIITAVGDDAATSLARRPHFPATLRMGNIQITPRPKAFGDTCLAESRYETRAWTLQERALSRTCLVFTDHQMLFYCQECGTRNEYVPNNLNPQHYELDRLAWFRELRSCRNWEEALSTDCYARLVQDYTSRVLSYPSDILNAFSGLAATIEEQFNENFAYGLPESIFDYSLLWHHSHYLPFNRRITEEPNQFPTWSWAHWASTGWVRSIHHHQKFLHQNGCCLESLIDEFYIEENNSMSPINRDRSLSLIRLPSQSHGHDYLQALSIGRATLHFQTRALSTTTFAVLHKFDHLGFWERHLAERGTSLSQDIIEKFRNLTPASKRNLWLIELSATRKQIRNRIWLMLVAWKDPVYERVLVGSIDQLVWESCSPEKTYIRLV